MERFSKKLFFLILALSGFLPGSIHTQTPTRLTVSNVRPTGRSVQFDARLTLPEGAQSGTFQIQETYAGLITESPALAKAENPDRPVLNLVIVIDATRSMSPRSFRQAVALASSIAGNLPATDHVAVYTINGKPDLKAAFSDTRETVLSAITGVERKGYITRIYDALFAGIFTAKSVLGETQDPSKSSPTKSAVLLLTDGRDEGSYLTDNDCIALSELGLKSGIPIYTVLYGNARNVGDKFMRLSLRTGAKMVRGEDTDGISQLKSSLGSSSARLFSFDYSLRSAAKAGEKVKLRLEWKSGRFKEEAEFEFSPAESPRPVVVPPVSFWTQERILLGVISLFVILSLTLLAVVWKYMERKKQLPEEATPELPIAAESPRQIEESTDPLDKIPYDPFDEEPYPPALSPPARFLKENSYKLLQLALRDGQKYSKAQLERKGKEREGINQEYELFFDTTVLGRGRWSHIHLDHPAASAVHAKIKKFEGKFVIYDMLSATGIYLNGKKILRPRGLMDGDEIRLGGSEFVFRGFRV